MTICVDILMAVYKGELYLDEQLHSIFTQTYQNFHLWIRDDLSPDSTLEVLKKWQQRFPDKISIIPSETNFGIIGNFSELMTHSRAPYSMFSDQDDVWLPNKIEVTLNKMLELEQQFGPTTPLLVHSDLCVVDKNLKTIHPSFMIYSNLYPNKDKLNDLLVQNVVTGCAVMMNRALLELSLPVPSGAVMHDWWVGLVASCFGKIGYVNQPTILYRQHGRNDTGAKKYSAATFLKVSVTKIFKKRRLVLPFTQAEALLSLSPKPQDQVVLNAFLSLPKLGYLNQRRVMIQYKFYKHGLLRLLSQLVR